MSNQNKQGSNKSPVEIYMWGIVGGAMCCYFAPGTAMCVVMGGVICVCAYGIIDVLIEEDKSSSNDMNFVEKEKIQYFKNK